MIVDTIDSMIRDYKGVHLVAPTVLWLRESDYEQLLDYYGVETLKTYRGMKVYITNELNIGRDI